MTLGFKVELIKLTLGILSVFNYFICFQILCHISHGAFGQVYHVRKVDTGDDYAMKILSKAKVIIILTLFLFKHKIQDIEK